MSQNFRAFNLQSFLLEAVSDLGFTTTTQIQKKIIPIIIDGKSVVGQSQTGSGKTHAFLLPILDNIDPEIHEVQAVITSPSRELSYQTYKVAKQLTVHSPLEIIIRNYVGGTDKQRQINKLQHEQPQIVIGTPGRILDLIQSQSLDVHTSKQFVIDEADITLDLGFLEDIDKILRFMPKKLQIMVFSATIPDKLLPFLRKYLPTPIIKKIPVKSIISPSIDNWIMSTKGRSKNTLIYKLLTLGNPYLALVFANTKSRVIEISNYLKDQGMTVATIHGDLQSRERKRVMHEVQNLKIQFVIATDLASRGIDIEMVSLVINDGIPEDLDYFIHRVGRTGRNGKKGTAITFYTPDDETKIEALEEIGIKFNPKELRNGEIIDVADRNQRKKRKKQLGVDLPGSLVGMINKQKKKIKPGYKRKIKNAISKEQRMNRRIQQRHERLEMKRYKKTHSERYK